VQLDAVLVERLFANLLENASKYTPADSPILITAMVHEEGERRFVKVEVHDNGPGLPAGMESRVFEKFTRGEKESAKPGIGLGLAICSAIVEAHGGKIGACNRLIADRTVRGATFWFTLPADETPPEPPLRDAEQADQLPEINQPKPLEQPEPGGIDDKTHARMQGESAGGDSASSVDAS
jgi:two-component system, OmpR family, sensor histidine kinase KdpD